MNFFSAAARKSPDGFTIVEVLVSALLIGIGFGSILATDVRSIRTLRCTRQAAAGSQMLQQRIEAIRAAPWPQISNSESLAQLMRVATESEVEVADSALTEYLQVTVPNPALARGAVPRSFSILRQGGFARVEQSGDFSGERTLMFESRITWRDVQGAHERHLRTIVCRAGLTRSGIFGSALGRAESR